VNRRTLLSEDTYKFFLKISENPKMRMFTYEKYKKNLDILSVAFGVFGLEKIIKKKQIRKFYIERFVKNHKNELKEILSELISYILLEKVEINFFNSNKKLIKKKIKNNNFKKSKITVLFSGGIDSYSGIFWAKKYFDNIEGIFCAHSDQAWNIHLVNFLSKELLSPSGIQLRTIYVPSITKGGYSQLRGFLYMISAGAWMNLLNSETLIVSECGPTMYQPRFGPYDLVTMTTHPVVVEIAHIVLELLLEKEISIITPFENMTKAEVIAISPHKDKLKYTHSCVSHRFGKHDGTCYGCIIRRLGAITAGFEDVEYAKNPIIDDKAKKENLLSLLMFSLEILVDYGDMPFYEIENIESYNKLDLFKRFALDNFAALYILKKEGYAFVKEVENLYEECLKRIGADILVKRIKSIKEKSFQINLTSV